MTLTLLWTAAAALTAWPVSTVERARIPAPCMSALLSSPVSVLGDWVARSHIYKLTDEQALKELHTDHLSQLEVLRDWDTTGSGPNGRRMVLGLFHEDDVRAVAAAEVSHASGLVVSQLLVYPAELNNEDSIVSLRMIHALHLLADAIETPLDLSRLEDKLGLEQLAGEIDDE